MIIITLNGVEGLFTLSLIFSVSVDTIKQWIAENNWDDELKSSRSGHQTFGDRLVFARKLKSYTMEVVSQKLNLSKLEYEKYEKNDAEPEFIIVQQLVDLLGVNPNWLMSGKGKYFNEWVPESDKFSTEKWRNEIRETINSEIKVKKGLMIALRDGLNAYLENQTESSM